MNPEIDPSLIIRAYLWAVLEANDPELWNTDNYGGLVPILPVSEEPEITEYNAPYLIYTNNHGPAYGPCRNGMMTIVLADTSFHRLNKTLNTVITTLDRNDETAGDINYFSTNQPSFIGLRFGWVHLSYAEGPVPEDTEGGRSYASLTIEYEYYVNYDITTRV